MKVKADRDEASPYAAMLAAQDVAAKCKELGISALHIKLRATGGNGPKTPGPGAQSALRALARSGMKIGRIGNKTHNGKLLVDDVHASVYSHVHRVHTSLSMHVCFISCRGCHTDSHRLDSQKGKSPWSPSINKLFVFSREISINFC